jgi:ABC-type transport system involved in multi-copper enzyme maturation permease subunit
MLNLIRSEWFILRRRPIVWVLLALLVGLFVLLRLTEYTVVALHDGTLTGGEARMALLRDEQVQQFRLQLAFPGIFGAALGHINSVGGLCAIVLAAGAVGSGYSWGTLRAALARRPDRGRWLLAKVATLLLALLAGIVIVLLVAALLGALLGGRGSVGVALLALPLGVLRALLVLLPYVMVTVASAIVGRGALAGAAGGFLFLLLDVGLGALSALGQLSPALALLVNLVLQPNINTLVVQNSRSFGLDPAVLASSLDLAALPGPLHAVLVIVAWSALFGGYARWALMRRDVGGAG